MSNCITSVKNIPLMLKSILEAAGVEPAGFRLAAACLPLLPRSHPPRIAGRFLRALCVCPHCAGLLLAPIVGGLDRALMRRPPVRLPGFVGPFSCYHARGNAPYVLLSRLSVPGYYSARGANTGQEARHYFAMIAARVSRSSDPISNPRSAITLGHPAIAPSIICSRVIL